ncbi:histone deacetylase 4-like isoform X1 [Lethenteron reissneri]|uniref:histone deacetylase 4-like isoform X1 n=2 Tax=Lethenteron reissneri TaxID=7753 RepID=UPI002AB7B51D|nr:histone deacetylase 4-like isoform X1 [Lethenteron reissneri]
MNSHSQPGALPSSVRPELEAVFRGAPLEQRGPDLRSSLHQQLSMDMEMLRRNHQLQQQLLLAEFQRKYQEMNQQHQSELQDRLQVLALRQQQELLERQLMQEQERDRLRKMQQLELNAIKRKDKDQNSAVASPAVRKHLQQFVKSRQPRESGTTISQGNGSGPTALGGPSTSEGRGNYPLRRIASEPILKVRSKLRQRVIEMRYTPLPLNSKPLCDASAGRKPAEGGLDALPSDSAPGSEQSSPNSSYSNIVKLNGTTGSVPNIHGEHALALAINREQSVSHPNLFTSPSLPNISLGLPQSASQGASVLSTQQEAERQAILAVRQGGALTGQFLASTPLPTQLPLAGPEPDGQHNLMYPYFTQSTATPPKGLVGCVVPGVAVAPQAGLRAAPTHRTVSRTHSAPLPQAPQGLQHMVLMQRHQQFLRRQQHLQQQQLQQQQMQQQQRQQLQNYDHPRLAHMEDELSPLRPAFGPGGVTGVTHLPATVVSGGPGPSSPPQMVAIKQEPREEEGQLGERVDERERQAEEQQQVLHTRQQRHLQSLMEQQETPWGLGAHLPLTRARSSPAHYPSPLPPEPNRPSFSTGVVYDTLMVRHQCSCGDDSNHPEHAGRIMAIWARLQQTGLLSKCEVIAGRKASLKDIQTVHSELHVLRYGTNPLNRQKLDTQGLLDAQPTQLMLLRCGGVGVDSDTYWSDAHSGSAARMAAGSVTTLAFHVASGQLKNGFAIVRPPGHHAEESAVMGFCVFNSVAIAAKLLQQELHVRRILIVDLDVHHGNGTQQAFYNDPRVLYLSLHRYDNGNFFPGSGASSEVGVGPGEGFTVNVPWTGGLDPPMGDADYLAAFRTVVMPIAVEFEPDVVLVSAGFDALDGHPPQLGGYKLTASCFGHLVRQLMSVANGRVVLSLEGGHELGALCDGTEACLHALLGDQLDPLPKDVLDQRPNQNAAETLEKVINIQGKYWASLRRGVSTVRLSALEAQRREREEVETVSAMASLSVAVRSDNGTPERRSLEPMEEEAD